MHQVVRRLSSSSVGVSQQQQQQRRRCSSSASYSRLPPGTRYPLRLPSSLDFRKGGFVLRQPPPPAPDQPNLDGCCSSVSSTTELITRHHRTIASLRTRSPSSRNTGETGSKEGPQKDTNDVITEVEKEEEEELEQEEQQQHQEEEQEEESEVLLALSESSCSSSSEESDSEQEVMSEEEAVAEGEELEEDHLFAKDYLLRVRTCRPHDSLLSVATLTEANSLLPATATL